MVTSESWVCDNCGQRNVGWCDTCGRCETERVETPRQYLNRVLALKDSGREQPSFQDCCDALTAKYAEQRRTLEEIHENQMRILEENETKAKDDLREALLTQAANQLER